MMEKLFGAWKLQEFIIDDSQGSKLWRPGAHGLLIYSETGHMSVAINSELSDGSVIDSMLFYSGTYEVEGKSVRHRVSNATDPQRIGQELFREAYFSDARTLKLTAHGDFGTAILTWLKL